MARDRVLLTGISGFIAGHVALRLLQAGYDVRGTVRGLDKADAVRDLLAAAGANIDRLSFVAADLTDDAGWMEAAAGCRYVLHSASPFPASPPRDRHALVPAAVDGTLRVMAAAERAGVERVVLTSSAAAIYSAHPPRPDERYGEADWSDTESPDISAYALSKTLAERAAWDAARDTGLDLVAINPALVLGPLLGAGAAGGEGTSAALIRTVMEGRMPVVPDLAFALADVRDVADAHLAAMTTPSASRRRFALSSGTLSLIEIGKVVGEACPGEARRLPRWTLPDRVVRLTAILSPQARAAVPELGRRKSLDTTPARDILGLSARSPEDAVAAMAQSIAQLARTA
ncbi:NAD-dependent epimerase/dehydratase family protein [Aurantimonas coralicida]|uniref:NAD-dependent epimerase/dehydratase family protein n=1 Tax=Aurantimonas coralicida TaxID=182270 RepID=UPI001D1838C7|nr:NAD-dependent epimerase/dehydratase family protein [Aurantimonas coralicida]MCC4299298.1 NAD-dependent epimerase/dehydratase family protein [Aurantimonas coralicida]